MKTVYYVVGPECSGKTTMSERLGKRMGLKVYHADIVYEMLKEEHSLSIRAEDLIHPAKWDNPRNFCLESWGDFPDIYAAKAPLFGKMLQNETDDFIIEGFTLSFIKERDLVEKAIGKHRAIILRIDAPYETWASFRVKREVRPLSQHAYQSLQAQFAPQENDTVFTFNDLNLIDVHYAKYQKPEFTDKKISALQIPVVRGDVVNDIGCNEGLIGKWCLERGATSVNGYDQNWRFLDKAAQNGLSVFLGDIEFNPIHSADLTLCVSTFHYFGNPRRFIWRARNATRRLLVLELPVYQSEQLLAEYAPQSGITRYSAKLIECWLKEHFSRVELKGASVPPSDAHYNDSNRLVYHCYVN